MEGGNGVSVANGITHSPTGEQDAEECAKPTDAAENAPRMDSALGVLANTRYVNLHRIGSSSRLLPTAYCLFSQPIDRNRQEENDAGGEVNGADAQVVDNKSADYGCD